MYTLEDSSFSSFLLSLTLVTELCISVAAHISIKEKNNGL